MSSKDNKLPEGITLRSDGRYMARFVVDGERYTLYDRNVKKLAKKMQEKRYELEHGFYCKETNITVEAWFETWIKEYKENSVKEGTIEAYRQNFSLYIKPELGKRKLTQVRPEHIQRLLNNMTNKYAPATINLTYIILGGMYKQAIKNKLLVSNPMTVVVAPKKKGTKKKIRVLSMEEQKMFLEFAQESSYYDMYIVALNTGMRLGDADGKISLNQQKPSKHAGLRRFGPEKFLQRNNEFMKERPIFYKKPIKTEKDFSTWLRCFYYTTKAVITEYIYF